LIAAGFTDFLVEAFLAVAVGVLVLVELFAEVLDVFVAVAFLAVDLAVDLEEVLAVFADLAAFLVGVAIKNLFLLMIRVQCTTYFVISL
jgi:hypothetical protein